MQSRKRREKAQMTLEELKKEGRVHVRVQPISIFLLRNGACPNIYVVLPAQFTPCLYPGTVISILPQNCSDFAEPIMARLRQPETGLRTSVDASLLVQSLLDLGASICSMLASANEAYSRGLCIRSRRCIPRKSSPA